MLTSNCPTYKMAVALLGGQLCMTVSEEQNIRNVLLDIQAETFSVVFCTGEGSVFVK